MSYLNLAVSIEVVSCGINEKSNKNLENLDNLIIFCFSKP